MTGFNKAFYINSTQRQELISQDKNSDKIVKPLLRGREVKRWVVDGEDNWLINPHDGLKSKSIERIDIVKDYPAIYMHLKQYKKKLARRLASTVIAFTLQSMIERQSCNCR